MPFNFPSIDKVRRPSSISPLQVIRSFKADPVGTQTRLLRNLTRKASGTEWGKRFGFAEIAEAKDPVRLYQERVPFHHYDAYRSDVERIRQGEKDIIWPGQFKHFAVSSGTASAGKIIPLSQDMLDVNRRFTMAVAMSYFKSVADPSFLFGRLLSIPGRIEDDPLHPGSWIGEVSGLQFLVTPAVIRKFYQAVPRDILFLPNWEEKLDAIVEHTYNMNIRAMAMVPSWAPVLFRKLIAHHNKVNEDSASTVSEIWPNLEVFFSGGVALSSYRTLLEEQIGGSVNFVENYGASEGYVSFQDNPNAEDMLVHLDTGVFLNSSLWTAVVLASLSRASRPVFDIASLSPRAVDSGRTKLVMLSSLPQPIRTGWSWPGEPTKYWIPTARQSMATRPEKRSSRLATKQGPRPRTITLHPFRYRMLHYPGTSGSSSLTSSLLISRHFLVSSIDTFGKLIGIT